MKDSIRNLFTIWQGHQITDEEIYNSKGGKYPIITGHNETKGSTDKPYITDVPCITIPSKGIVNKLYIQTQPFDANNTIALVPKNREKIELEYVVFTQQFHITRHISSTNTNNYLNRGVLENIEIEYPKRKKQIEIAEQFKKLLLLRELVEQKLRRVNQQIELSVYEIGDKVSIPSIFNVEVGHDDNLTEKYAYDNIGKIPIYSGASDNDGIFRYTNRIDYDYDDYITWSISGKAGTMFHRHGSCCLTRDCGIIIPKEKKKINLDWFILTQKTALQQFAIGRGGLGRLKKNLIVMYFFVLPKREIQDAIVKEHFRLFKIKKSLESIIEKLDNKLACRTGFELES